MTGPQSRRQLLTEEELVLELAGRIGRRRDQKRVAHQLGISQGGLANILSGHRRIGNRTAAALGYRRRVLFEPVE